ncbi:MAG TPA: hypothetical protein VIH54_12440 [Chthoniobacterales bacterium]
MLRQYLVLLKKFFQLFWTKIRQDKIADSKSGSIGLAGKAFHLSERGAIAYYVDQQIGVTMFPQIILCYAAP